MLADVSQEFQGPSEAALPTDAADLAATALPAIIHPSSSSLSPTSISLLGLTVYLGSALELLATLAFTLVLLVFFLLAREDLRDRIVLLAGAHGLQFPVFSNPCAGN